MDDAQGEPAMVLDAIGKWLDRDLRPHVLALDHADEYPAEMVEQMKALGLFGATIPAEYGGLGLNAATYVRLIEQIAAVWMALTAIINSHLIMAACVARHGSQSQKAAFLPKFATGAVRDGDDYVINGTKTRISNGIPATDLIGMAEGHGMQHALSGLELGRINIAARGCGLASAALMDSVHYAQRRKTFGKPIARHQAIQLKLGEMATRLQAARLLTYDAARADDSGERCAMEAGMAKYFASEAAVENALEALRIHGDYGYSMDYHILRYYRDAPLMCIGEGTNEIQRMIIAKQLFERNPA